MNAERKPCSGCARSDRPLVACADGRELCLACVEVAGDTAGIDADALEVLRWLTRLREQDTN